MKTYRKGHVPEGISSRYIGRGSPWGNPFIIGVAGDRATVIERYREYALERIKDDPTWLDPLKQVEGLVCYCAPLPCHGDVLISMLAY